MESIPKPVDIKKSRHDLTTFYGRLRHFMEVTSPLTLFYTNEDLRKAQVLISDYSSGQRPDLYGQEEKVWKAKQLVDSSIHPDTHEPVPLLFRLSAFVPTNLVIVAGMLSPSPTMFSIIAWQVANQSLNVCVNFSNANKSSLLTTSEITKAYFSAVGTSVGLAVGLNRLVPNLNMISAGSKVMIARFIPFTAVASAGCVNVALMRWKEIRDGIDVFSPPPPLGRRDDGEVTSLGKSSKAGQVAVAQTATSRVLTNIPTLIIPPIIMTALQRRGTFKGRHGRGLETAIHLGLIGSSLILFLPPAIAAFPQRASIRVDKLEPEFHNIIDPKTGQRYESVEFNKGL